MTFAPTIKEKVLRRKMRVKFLWGMIWTVAMALALVLCRYAWFDLHGMKQWPWVLSASGLVIILIFVAAGQTLVPASTLAGYLAGFGVAHVFSTQGVDPGGGTTSNFWILWSVVFVSFMIMGGIGTLACHRKKNTSSKSSRE